MARARLRVEAALVEGGELALTADVAHHARDVLRLRVGDAVTLFDREGREADAVLVACDGERVAARASTPRPSTGRPTTRVTLIAGLVKGERFDWVIEKATELGVARILPTATERAVVQLEGAKAEARVARWSRIAEGAARQCERPDVPIIGDVAPLPAHLQLASDCGLRLYAQERQSATLEADAFDAESAVIVVGPEGGLSPSEQARCEAQGYRALSLGPRILRADTAAVVALAVLQRALGELG